MSGCRFFLSVFLSFAFLTHVPASCHLFPYVIVLQRISELVYLINLVLADLSCLQHRQRPRAGFAINLSDASSGAIRTGNSGDSFNAIEINILESPSTSSPCHGGPSAVVRPSLRPADFSCETSPFALRLFWLRLALRKVLQVIAEAYFNSIEAITFDSIEAITRVHHHMCTHRDTRAVPTESIFV